MKRLYLIIALIACAQATTLAQAPCRFTWKAVILPNNTVADYTSPQIEQQPYQGPCMAFALAATLESQYEVDHNRPNRNLDLSEAFLDYKVYNWTNANVINVFDNNFAIPEQVAGNFSDKCTSEVNCPLLSQVRNCINNGQCFQVIDTYNETTHTWQQSVQCVACPPGMKRARGTNVVKINSSISSIDQFKSKLMFDGPMVLRLNGTVAANKLSNYGSTGYTFHAVSVIGWKEINGGIQLHFKDSWKGSAGFKYSKTITHAELLSLINQGQTNETGFELFQIRNAHVVNERVPYINFSYFSPGDQCTPIPPSTPSLMLMNEPVISRNQQMTLYAAINCSGEGAIDWEWVIPDSMVHTPVENSCNSTVVFSTNTQANQLQIKVRAKSSSGAWSNWHIKTFLVDDNLK
jgi:hypothetical protein